MTEKCSEGKNIDNKHLPTNMNIMNRKFYNSLSFNLPNRYHDIESISKEYAVEKVALEKALSDLKEVEGRKANLLEEKRLEEVN